MAKKSQFERRFVPFTEFEVRSEAGKPTELVGYASVFGQETIISDWWSGEYREEVAPGAWAKTISEADIRALFNHDPNIILGRNKAGTLQLSEDSKGLHTVILPPDNAWGRPVLDAVSRGDITGMSVTFQSVKEEWYWPKRSGSKELPKRTLREGKLFDVSPVTYPAFQTTSISARSAGQPGGEDPEVDLLLRAGQLARCAQHGLELTAEDRALVAEAVGILRSYLPTAEPAGILDAGHSDARHGEPARFHSLGECQRTLELLTLTL